MTRKANRPKKHRKELHAQSGTSEPVNIFGCPDCSLLIFEPPDTESINCPWCRQIIDVHATYSHMAFSRDLRLRLPTNAGENFVVSDVE